MNEKLKKKRDEAFLDWQESFSGPSRIRLEYYRKFEILELLVRALEN